MRYRRSRAGGGAYFFTVNLADRWRNNWQPVLALGEMLGFLSSAQPTRATYVGELSNSFEVKDACSLVQSRNTLFHDIRHT
jgi:hypothetical protein